MRITRLVAGAVTAGLLGVTPVALTASAGATENLTTTTTAVPSATELTYGDDFYVSSDVTDSAGSPNFDGTSTLYAMEAGSSTWAPVATVNAGYGFYDVKPRKDTTYKVVFSGYAATSTYEDNLAASESAPFAVAVTRKVTFNNPRGTFVKGKISPDYKKKPIKVQKKVGKRWVKFRTFKTTKRSTYSFTLPAPRRGKWFWKITVPGGSDFTDWVAVVNTYSFRSSVDGRVASLR